MQLSHAGFELIKRFEGCQLEAYADTGGIPTLGWGTTRYPAWYALRPKGRVLLGDVCTQEQADMYFRHDLQRTEVAVDDLTIDSLLQRQFDSLVSFTYNLGEGAFRTSTLRKMVNEDPDNPAIRQQFMKWVYDDGRRIQGLVNRRQAETNFYFGMSV